MVELPLKSSVSFRRTGTAWRRERHLPTSARSHAFRHIGGNSADSAGYEGGTGGSSTRRCDPREAGQAGDGRPRHHYNSPVKKDVRQGGCAALPDRASKSELLGTNAVPSGRAANMKGRFELAKAARFSREIGTCGLTRSLLASPEREIGGWAAPNPHINVRRLPDTQLLETFMNEAIRGPYIGRRVHDLCDALRSGSPICCGHHFVTSRRGACKGSGQPRRPSTAHSITVRPTCANWRTRTNERCSSARRSEPQPSLRRRCRTARRDTIQGVLNERELEASSAICSGWLKSARAIAPALVARYTEASSRTKVRKYRIVRRDQARKYFLTY